MDNATTEDYRRLITDKFKPATDTEKIYVGIIMDLAGRLDLLEGAVGVLQRQDAAMIKAIRIVGATAARAAGITSDEGEAEGTAVEPEAEGPQRQQDQTPFPAGAAVKAAAAAAPSTLDEVQAAAAAPDAGSGPAMNAAPIPTRQAARAPQQNGPIPSAPKA